jgi:putative phosphoesterase
VRILVLADTHLGGRRPVRLPPAVVAAARDAELILHAGDLVVPDVLAELEAYAPTLAVLGNVDGWELADRLPTTRVVDAGPIAIGMVHIPGPDAGRRARLRTHFPGCRVVVFGHTHLPVCEDRAGLLLLNPGSPIERRRAPRHTFAQLDVSDDGRVDAQIVPLADAAAS